MTPPTWEHPQPPPHPELPDGVVPATGDEHVAAWAPWTAWVALLAAFSAALFAGIAVAGVGAAAGADINDPPPAVNIVALFLQDGFLIGSAWLFARLAARPSPFQFGLRRSPRWGYGAALGGYFAFLLFALAWTAALGTDAEDDLPQQLGADESDVALIAVALLVTVGAPLAEEIFFRGYFFTALKQWRGFWPAALVTGLVFGTIHAASSPIEFIVPLAFFGFMLCALYERTGSLYPCIVLHAINNSVAFGASMDWGAGILLLLALSLAAIAAILTGVQRLAPRLS